MNSPVREYPIFVAHFAISCNRRSAGNDVKHDYLRGLRIFVHERTQVHAFSHLEDYALQRQEAIGPKSNWPESCVQTE
jgi:hypothetical protein